MRYRRPGRFTLGLSPSQLLDDGLGQILIDLVMPWHRLRLFCAAVGIPIVTPAVANQCAAHVFERLDKFASFHLRDQEFFYLADIGYFANFNVFQEIFQVLG